MPVRTALREGPADSPRRQTAASLELSQFPEDTGRSTKALHPKAQYCPKG